MAVRPIDGNKLIEWFSPYLHTGEPIPADVVIEDIRSMPTLTPPNEWVSVEERCKELEERCKRLNEARERANEAAHKWETMYRGKKEELEISQNEVSTMSTAGMEMLNAFSEYVRNGSKNPAAYCYYGAAGCGGDGDGCKGVAHCNFLPKSGMTG